MELPRTSLAHGEFVAAVVAALAVDTAAVVLVLVVVISLLFAQYTADYSINLPHNGTLLPFLALY